MDYPKLHDLAMEEMIDGDVTIVFRYNNTIYVHDTTIENLETGFKQLKHLIESAQKGPQKMQPGIDPTINKL